MDVTRVLSDLRSEREDIEHAILSLERLDRPSAQPTDAAAQSAAGISVVKAPNES